MRRFTQLPMCWIFTTATVKWQTSRRARREAGESTKTTRVGLADQASQASFPVLATGDAVAVDDALNPVSNERQLVGEAQVVAAVRDEDAKLAPSGDSDRLA